MGHTTLIEEFAAISLADSTITLEELTSLETKGQFKSFANVSISPPGRSVSFVKNKSSLTFSQHH